MTGCKASTSEWISSDSIDEFYEASGVSPFAKEFRVGKASVARILILEKLTREIRAKRPVRILDFGCGAGQFLSVCANFGFDCVGVEFGASRHKTKWVDFFPSLSGVEEEHGDRSFDAITLIEVLEHLPDPLATLKSLARHIKDQGILVLETPNCEAVTTISSERDYRLIHPLAHINGFDPTTLERIAVNAGFRKVTPGIAQVTPEPMHVYKREVKRLLEVVKPRRSTQMFFQKA